MSAQAIIELECHPADFHTGFELGWDHARFRVTPPAEQLTAASPVYQGFRSGQGAFGDRARCPNRHVRSWLQLRLDAWLRGQAFEGIQVTPNHLAQIDVEYCPITRVALTLQTGRPSDAAVDRVRDDAAYAAGNLAVMSARARQAKADCTVDQAIARACQVDLRQPGPTEALNAAEWARLAALMSYVTELPHERALRLPLRVLPPNRLRLLNPIQALQALVTLQLVRPGYGARIDRIEQLIPGHAARRDFRLFFMALLPRVLEAGRAPEPQALRWALEDAWGNDRVDACWQRFARQLTAAQAESVVARAVAGTDRAAPRVAAIGRVQATDGWALESRGRVAPAGHAPRDPAAAPPRSSMSRRAAAGASRPERPATRQTALDLVVH